MCQNVIRRLCGGVILSKIAQCTLYALDTKVWKINSFLQLFFYFISYFFVSGSLPFRGGLVGWFVFWGGHGCRVRTVDAKKTRARLFPRASNNYRLKPLFSSLPFRGGLGGGHYLTSTATLCANCFPFVAKHQASLCFTHLTSTFLPFTM